MAAANHLLTEDQLWCSICLDVFTDPVTLPCGHNFCKTCITQHLQRNSKRQCPLCNKHVDRKYKLGVNTLISGMAVQFRQSAGKKARNNSDQHVAGNVSIDGPTGAKLTALKCLLLALALVCLILYCAWNLRRHQTAASLCTEHDKPLELYCKNEQMPICRSCADSNHRYHHIVSLKEEYEVKKTELRKTEAGIQQKMLERRLKTQEIKHSLKFSREAADREMAGGVQVFSALIQTLERTQAELIEMIEEKQKSTEKRAKGFIRELEQEISELVRRRAEVEQLSRSKDHLHFLQSFPSLNAAPLAKDWTDVSICPASYGGMVRMALFRAVDQMVEINRNQMRKLHEAEAKSAVDVTLDPDTAHPALILSDDGKQVRCGDGWNKLPDSSKRFELATIVLGKQGFSCGRFHYDVQVQGTTGWTLGGAKESVNRKEETELNPENGYWSICLHKNYYFALASPPVALSVDYHPEVLTVFVDYEEGLVSFHDRDAAALLYSFTGCSFTEKLHPFFRPGKGDGVPLIISPANQHEFD